MPQRRVNGVELHVETAGAGEPLVLVHGSWADHHNWDLVLPAFAERFEVIAYDRRGHSESDRPPGQGSMREDSEDLIELIHDLGRGPAHVLGNSSGAVIALRAAAREPDALRTLVVHEPPLFGLLAGTEFESGLGEVGRRVGAVGELLDAGDHERAAQLFVDTVALGPGAWEQQLTPEVRETFIANAPTFQDELRDRDGQQMDLGALAAFDHPALVTSGTASPPLFAPVADMVAGALPNGRREALEGADHLPHVSMPERYVELVTDFIDARPAS